MRSNYRRIGDFIQLVDERNRNLEVTTLLGLSISKVFIPSVANIIGTDMENYKIIRKNQFACSTMQVRRDGKMPVALLKDFDKAIISPAYPVFEVIDNNVLLPEYLMMWFSRSEFDREACFYAVGGVRGSLEWEDFLDMQLPVPSPEKQRQLVNEYHVLVDRITINNRLIQKLEETAQAVYKEWFVDFEFPDTNDKPYKSNSGEMKFNKELEKEIPQGWEMISIKDFCSEMKSGGTPSRDNIEFWNSRDIPWFKTGELNNGILIESEEYISNEGCLNSSAKKLPINSVLIAMYGEGKTKGQVGFLKVEATTNQACCAMICKNIGMATYLYYYLQTNRDLIANMANGGAQPNLSKALIEELRIMKPSIELFEKHPFEKIINLRESITRELLALDNLKDLLLSKLATIN